MDLNNSWFGMSQYLSLLILAFNNQCSIGIYLVTTFSTCINCCLWFSECRENLRERAVTDERPSHKRIVHFAQPTTKKCRRCPLGSNLLFAQVPPSDSLSVATDSPLHVHLPLADHSMLYLGSTSINCFPFFSLDKKAPYRFRYFVLNSLLLIV